MDSGVIHETVVRDIVDVLTDIKDYDEVQFLLNKKSTKSFKSAASATKDMILTFPVICSSDLDIQNAVMISKAIERKAVAMMQMLFSAISISSSDNAIEYLKKIHTNIDFGSNDVSISNVVDTVEKIGTELEAMDMAEIDHAVFDEMAKRLREIDHYLPDSVSETSISNYTRQPDGTVLEAKSNNSPTYTTNVNSGGINRVDTLNQFGDVGDQSQQFINSRNSGNTTITTVNGATTDQIRAMGIAARNIARATADAHMSDRDRAGTKRDRYEAFSKQILPSEIKKANELMPTLMVVTFNQKLKDVDDVVESHVVIGIKAKLYPVDSNEIINRIKAKVQDNNWLNKFIKATTNEISFVKDFMFAIDKAKLDASTYSRKTNSSKLWRILERRSSKSKIRRTMRMSNDASAISTLLVSQNVVEYLKKNDNIDLEDVKIANQLMESYNFMCISICDEQLETAKFIYDTGDDIYETLSFSHLEREASDSAYKKVINLMTKMQR